MFNHWLDRITMYRLTTYYLSGLLLAACGLSILGILPYNPLDILITTSEVLGGCLLANQIMADLLKANSNTESTVITALILALIITPKFPLSFQAIAVAGAFAIGSKYLATILEHHVFNPAAAGLIALALLTDTSATWWVGTPALLPFVVIGGYLLVKKINREKMVLQFLATALVIVGAMSLLHTMSLSGVLYTWWMSLSHTALLFFTAVMFTEPSTSPGTAAKRGYFAVLCGVLYTTPQLGLGIVFTPEMALAIANIFSFAINPQYRYVFVLKLKKLIARDTYEFYFEPQTELKYLPGQFMEWTLPHPQMDNRGNRRYFSLSSTDNEMPAFAIKYYEPPSSYKRNLVQMPIGATLSATNVAGDFVIQDTTSKPIVMIAGGIGIAPFRSMIKDIVDKARMVDITLVYINKTADEICYSELFEQAKVYGVKTHYFLTETSGHLSTQILQSLIPNCGACTYYISGPQRLVEACEELLGALQIPKNQVVTDFFPGY